MYTIALSINYNSVFKSHCNYPSIYYLTETNMLTIEFTYKTELDHTCP